jgi:hypothetical protein
MLGRFIPRMLGRNALKTRNVLEGIVKRRAILPAAQQALHFPPPAPTRVNKTSVNSQEEDHIARCSAGSPFSSTCTNKG